VEGASARKPTTNRKVETTIEGAKNTEEREAGKTRRVELVEGNQGRLSAQAKTGTSHQKLGNEQADEALAHILHL